MLRKNRDLSTTVKMMARLKVGGTLLACKWVYEGLSGMEVVNADMTVSVNIP